MVQSLPDDQVFWYLNYKSTPRLRGSIKTDVVVVGGGMAGISAAQSFQKKGLKVVLLERAFCGSGASGKNSGFITPDSELSLSDLVGKYGKEPSKKLWQFVESGVSIIRTAIADYSIDCDYIVEDTLVLADSKRAFVHDIQSEHNTRLMFNYPSTLIKKENLHDVVGSNAYHGALCYPGSFGICAFKYCQAMKVILQDYGNLRV